MKIIIRNYSQNELQFFDVYPASDNASQPTTSEELEIIRPRSLGSNEQLEVMEDSEAKSYIQKQIDEGFIDEVFAHTHNNKVITYIKTK